MYKKGIIEIVLNSGFEITPDTLDYLSLQKESYKFLKKFD